MNTNGNLAVEEAVPFLTIRPEKKAAGNRCAWFSEARFGLFIHWGLYSIPARGEWIRSIEKYRDEDYYRFFEEFDPKFYNPREWAKLARAAGQKYVVMTAKHHDGFCLFESKLTSFKASCTRARRDLIREYVDAFRAEGLKVGVYYSLIDWNHPGYPVDQLHPLREVEGAKEKERDFDTYLDYFHGQVEELLTNYGKIDIMWFDFSYGTMSGETWRATQLVESIRRLHPDIIIDNRLTCGHDDANVQDTGFGDFTSPEQIIPPQGVTGRNGRPLVWEACITLNDHWGYVRDDHNYKSSTQAIRMLVECVSKGGNLLLNIGPDAKGRIPEASVERLKDIGHWLERNGESIYGCGRADYPKPDWGRYTQNGDRLYAHVFEKPVGPIPLLGLGGKIRQARWLADGSEIDMKRPWNAGKSEDDAFLNLPGSELPDPRCTVIELELL